MLLIEEPMLEFGNPSSSTFTRRSDSSHAAVLANNQHQSKCCMHPHQRVYVCLLYNSDPTPHCALLLGCMTCTVPYPTNHCGGTPHPCYRTFTLS